MCSERIGDAGAAAPLPERRRVLLGGAAVGLSMMAAGLAGCGGGGLDDDAALRAVNATAHLAQVDLLFNDWRFATAVGYGGQASAYARRPVWSVGAAGLFEAKQTGQTALLARKILALPEGDSGSVVLTGSQSTGLNMRILDENTPRPAGAQLRLRVLHGLPVTGQAVPAPEPVPEPAPAPVPEPASEPAPAVGKASKPKRSSTARKKAAPPAPPDDSLWS